LLLIRGVVTCLAMRCVEGKSTRLASGSSDGSMRIWDHHEGKTIKHFTTNSTNTSSQGGGVLCTAWGPPGMVLAGCGDSSVIIMCFLMLCVCTCMQRYKCSLLLVGDVSCCIVIVCVSIVLYNFEYEYECVYIL